MSSIIAIAITSVHTPYSTAKTRRQGEGGRDVPSKEVPKVVEFAMLFILDVNDSPTILSTSDGFAIDDDISL